MESWIQTATRAWPGLVVADAPYGTGLINDTRKGTYAGAPIVLQRVHPAFASSVHDDIEAVTGHLAARQMTTTRLVRTHAGELSTADDEGRSVRVLTFVDGASRDKLPDGPAAEAAGALVARFHVALLDLEHTYVHTRPGIHDVPYRLRGLEDALLAHRAHRLYDAVAPLADQIRDAAASFLGPNPTRLRHAHGDLKASNLLFADDGAGITIVDLDTIAAMSWPFEMGDALRSWCNPHGEDVSSPSIDVGLFEAALRGYARHADEIDLEQAEIEALVSGVRTIATELAARFLTDALEEKYFGWDPTRYATRGDHDLIRARGQWSLAESVLTRRSELEGLVVRTLPRPRG